MMDLYFCYNMTSWSYFFDEPPTTEIYTLSLHDALPISLTARQLAARCQPAAADTMRKFHALADPLYRQRMELDRKSTRLNSSHPSISYAVFCLKKKTTTARNHRFAARSMPLYTSIHYKS